MEKAEKLSADLALQYHTVLTRVIEENNFGSRREGLNFVFAEFLRNEEKRNPQAENKEPFKQNSKESAPSIDLNTLLPCTHREIIPPQESDKNHIEYWCVFRRPCTPIQAKEIKHLQFCRSCQSQQYQLPASHSAETEADKPEPEPEQIKPVFTIPTQPNWNSKLANVVNHDGSKMCPYNTKPQFSLDCRCCKVREPEKFKQCVQLRALITINTQNKSF